MINENLSDEEKYITLIHEILHCTIDEAKLLVKDDEEKLIMATEKDLRDSF